MNELIYYLLNKIHGVKVVDDDILERLYYFYLDKSNFLGCNMDISCEDLKKVISIIYDVIRFRIDDDEFIRVIVHYLSLLIVDAKADNCVDLNWCIKYIWYLGCRSVNSAYLGMLKDIPSEKYKDCIPFIQKMLIKEFKIRETKKEQKKRKVYTKLMVK